MKVTLNTITLILSQHYLNLKCNNDRASKRLIVHELLLFYIILLIQKKQKNTKEKRFLLLFFTVFKLKKTLMVQDSVHTFLCPRIIKLLLLFFGDNIR